MAQVKTDHKIEVADIEDYLEGSSDFAFELRVLQKLNSLGFTCQHSGVYEDPITAKSREFDIRAFWSNEFQRLKMSVECKNIREYSPLLAHCVKRTERESYHDLVLSLGNNKDVRLEAGGLRAFSDSAKRYIARESLYPPDRFVAKSIDQIAKDTAGKFKTSDSSVFEKISQSINGSYELLCDAHFKGTDMNYRPNGRTICFVLPVLVVPDEMLWEVKYNDDGTQEGPPEKTERVSLYLGKEWLVHSGSPHLRVYLDSETYSLSHLEIITFSVLDKFFETFLWEYIFPQGTPEELLNRTPY